MKKIKVSFDTWVQLLGMVGILGGLVFVGLEMRQTQQIAVAGQVQARTQMQVDRWLTPLEGNLDTYRFWNTNSFEYEDLSEEGFLGDIAICSELIAEEAISQGKEISSISPKR